MTDILFENIPLWPGEPPVANKIDRILRVDLAGEKGAKRIYEGQLWGLKNHPVGPLIQHMYEQECSHAQEFEARLKAVKGRPTLLEPLWHAAGFGLGALSALLGVKAAMACTAAVEEVIDTHYARQICQIKNITPTLANFLEHCRVEEVAHRDQAVQSGAQELPFYGIFSAFIRGITRSAVALSERI